MFEVGQKVISKISGREAEIIKITATRITAKREGLSNDCFSPRVFAERYEAKATEWEADNDAKWWEPRRL
ncbi:hypothetical protein EVC03_080 [Rhizobium phage RHph_Y5A]|nr:hypothetical protein EVC03_080 [Rhizobium phage RHph_Y5A]QIG75522.1 hypothetical protein EVC18_080 [Rhizobium phage RHph_Y2_4]